MQTQKTMDYSWRDVESTVECVLREWGRRYAKTTPGRERMTGLKNIYAIPRGEAVPGEMLARRLGVPLLDAVDSISSGTLLVDDIGDSGETLLRYLNRPVWGISLLVAKPTAVAKFRGMNANVLPQWVVGKFIEQKIWLTFPWERLSEGEETVEDNVLRMLEFIGEDTKREGLIETPKRVVRMWKEVFYGYTQPRPILKSFSSESTSMVVKTGIRAYSFCEHHLVPIILNVNFAYIPDGKVVGISKVIRLINWCCARLILQEELVEEIVSSFQESINPQGVACIIQGLHLCELTRGVKTQNVTTTSALSGVFKNQPATRTEMLKLMELQHPFAF